MIRLSDIAFSPSVMLLAAVAAVVAWSSPLACPRAEAQPVDAATGLAFELGGIQVNEPFHPLITAEPCRPVRPQDEVWTINTRQVPTDVTGGDPAGLQAFCYHATDHSWKPQDVRCLFQKPHVEPITFIYVHGNRANPYRAIEQGWQVYHSIVMQSENPQPVRFIIWSWPSTQVRGLLKDLRSKAQRTETEGQLLGRFITELPPGQRVSLLGFSYGSRVVTGAMHFAAGGMLSGDCLPDHVARRAGGVRTVSIAGALHDCWLSPGGYHEMAVTTADRMLLIHNHCDVVLKRYGWLFRRQRARALGYRGLPYYDQTGRIDEYDAAGIVGESHDSLRYFSSPQLMGLARDYVLWQHPAGM